MALTCRRFHLIENAARYRNQWRSFQTTQRIRSARDQSTIDFAYLPRETFEPVRHFTIPVPILPVSRATHGVTREQQQPDVQPITRPEIYTVSANGTHIDSPSAMSDVVDNHAAEIDHFELTRQVTSAATAGARLASRPRIPERGTVGTFLTGVLDDLMGERRPVHA